MKEVKVNLNSVEKVKKFCGIATYSVDGDIDLVSGKYTIDGKSIMGIFSLDLTKPITMRVEDSVDITSLEEFFVKEDTESK